MMTRLIGGAQSTFSPWHQPRPIDRAHGHIRLLLRECLRSRFSPLEEDVGIDLAAGTSPSNTFLPPHLWAGACPVRHISASSVLLIRREMGTGTH